MFKPRSLLDAKLQSRAFGISDGPSVANDDFAGWRGKTLVGGYHIA